MTERKVFGLWSAIFLGIGSVVGSGVFVLLGEAVAIIFALEYISKHIPNVGYFLTGFTKRTIRQQSI